MLGQLPQTLTVCGTEYDIRSDFRNILTIIAAYNDDSLSETEKTLVCLRRMYPDLEQMPRNEETFTAALQAAHTFIECKLSDDRPSPKVVNWEKDEQLIFPAINKVAGTEVRMVEYMHWWTFLGYFMSVDTDGLWGAVLTIRQKKARGKKLEKHEKEFLTQNPELCALETREVRGTPEDALRKMFEQLVKEGGADNGG
jgi:hypothetical protein